MASHLPSCRNATPVEHSGAKVWDTKTWEVVASPRLGHWNRVWSCVFSPDGKRLTVVGQDDTGGDNTSTEIAHWSVVDWKMLSANTSRTLVAGGVAYSRDGALFAESEETIVRVRSAASSELRWTLRGHREAVTALVFHPDGQRLVSGGATEVKVWDLVTGQELLQVTGKQSDRTSLAFTRDGTTLVRGGGGEIRLYRAAPAAEARTLPVRAACLAFRPDGT